MSNPNQNTVAEYDAITGATINATFINGQGLNGPLGLALDGNNHLFVSYGTGTAGMVGEYDATTGATINSALVSGLINPEGLLYVSAVPEPSSLLLLAAAAGLGVGIRRRQCFAGPRLAVLAALVVGCAASPARARQVLLVANETTPGTIGVYNAVTGATINSAVISGQGLTQPDGLAFDGHNHLFVAGQNNGIVGEYDATTGATVNANFVNVGPNLGSGFGALAVDGNNHLFVSSGPGLRQYNATTGALINGDFVGAVPGLISGLALDNHNHIFVASFFGQAVGEYDATTGATINASFVTIPSTSEPVRIAVDALNHLFVAQRFGTSTQGVGVYDATTGASISAAFIPVQDPWGIAVDGSNHVFVSSNSLGTIGEYDATTGATINANYVTGLHFPTSVAFIPVPEPSSLLLVAAAAGVGAGIRRPKWLAGRRHAALLVRLTVRIAAGPAHAQPVLLVANGDPF
jgi:hypothetical protein